MSKFIEFGYIVFFIEFLSRKQRSSLTQSTGNKLAHNDWNSPRVPVDSVNDDRASSYKQIISVNYDLCFLDKNSISVTSKFLDKLTHSDWNKLEIICSHHY